MNSPFANLRINAGYKTQIAFAKAINDTRAAVAKWERGFCYPPTQKITILSQALHVSADEIIEALKKTIELKTARKEA